MRRGRDFRRIRLIRRITMDSGKASSGSQGFSSNVNRFRVGDRVRCGDRDNLGTVAAEDTGADTVLIHFEGRDGREVTKPIERSLLTLVARPAAAGRPAAGVPAGDGDWPEISLPEAPKVLPFPVDALPPDLRSYAVEMARAKTAPVDFVGSSMVVVAGSAIGTTLRVRLRDDWCEYPLLWNFLVGPTGTTKTPAATAVSAPLIAVDRRLRRESARDIAAWQEEKPEKGEPRDPMPPRLRAIVKDVTRESVAVVLADNARGLLLAVDEATAWIRSFGEYKGGRGGDREFWLSVWSSLLIAIDRKGPNNGKPESICVQTPFVSVVTSITPDSLDLLVDEKKRADGFVERMLYSAPDVFPPRTWQPETIPAADISRWQWTVARLVKIPLREEGDDGEPRPFDVDLTPEARAAWVAWYDAWGRRMAEMEHSRQVGWMQKAFSTAARLSLILAAMRKACLSYEQSLGRPDTPPDDAPGDEEAGAGGGMSPDRLWFEATDDDDPGDEEAGEGDIWSGHGATDVHRGLEVGVEDVQGAIRLIEYFESTFAKVDHIINQVAARPRVRAIVGWIRRRGCAEFREAGQGGLVDDLRWLADNPIDFRDAMMDLVNMGIIRAKPEEKIPGKRGPKPSRSYEVNPDFLHLPDST
jgi:hypothetical protein